MLFAGYATQKQLHHTLLAFERYQGVSHKPLSEKIRYRELAGAYLGPCRTSMIAKNC